MQCFKNVLTVVVISLVASELILAQDIRFPEDARIVRVTDFGAIPDDGLDDTQAIQNAIIFGLTDDPTIGRGRYGAPPFIYLPKGTYRISDSLETRTADHTGWSAGWRAGTLLHGESRTETILKLDDNAVGFGDPADPKPVIKTGSESDGNTNEEGGGNRAFRHSIINMTIDVGSGNSGAVGIDYVASNRGVVKDVDIISSDPGYLGFCGIRMDRWWPGPALIKRVSITGFDYGIRMAHYQYSMTFEHIHLQNQLVTAINNVQNTLTMRDLTSINTVPVINNANSTHGHIIVIDGEFTGGDPSETAVVSEGTLLLRNVTVAGYGKAVDDLRTADKDVDMTGPSTLIEEYATSLYSLFTSPQQTLRLTVKESPEFHTNDFGRWANVDDYGATPADSSDDDAPAIQAAIDSGAEIVYLPNGGYHISRPVILRNQVRKFMGMQSSLAANSGFQGSAMIQFDGGDADNVVVEHIRLGSPPDTSGMNANILHNSTKGLVIRHFDAGGLGTGGAPAYTNSAGASGDMFWEDVIGRGIRVNAPQSFWARQLNAEFGDLPLVENLGGNLWILGMKTEGEMTTIRNIGGQVELFGGFWYPLGPVDPSVPLIINDEGNVTLNWTRNGSYNYNIWVRERRDGVWSELTSTPRSVSLYTGYRTADIPTNLTASLVQTNPFAIELNWSYYSAEPTSAMVIERKPWQRESTWHEIAVLGPDARQYTDTGPLYGHITYSYRVGAVKD